MASRKVDVLHVDTKDLATASDSLSRSSPDDIMEELQPDVPNTSVKSPKSGKFRTALTFFGVRKSICILPSFFGGRSKNHSKKGIPKSKTHDGLSKVCHDDSLGGRCTSPGDCAFHCQKDSPGELHATCRNECSHPSAEQKSMTLGRQKKGFRSLFNSFRHHRNHRTDKAEMIAMSSPRCKKDVPVVQDSTNEYVTECLGSEPDVPDFADVICNVSNGPECSDADAVASDKSVEQEGPKSELDDPIEDLNLMAAVSSDSEEASKGHSEPCHKVPMVAESVLKLEASTGSSDQLNMIYGDVASLKSFDSLTGCGDIIADQEDDSLTESTVSGERSRNGGKRASCYLTYQGGGEEMASPEELDEKCFQDLWASNAIEERCCSCNEDHTDMTAELTSSHNMDLINSNSAQQASGMDTSSIADVLTPPSEQQESAPTSDEGYYDSTTPGPDEGQDKADRLRTDGLPRDSYSGDALYELFAPDESLISPHYENKTKLPGSRKCEYLSDSADAKDSAFVPEINGLQRSAELYNVHELAQNALGRQENSMNTGCNLNSTPQVSGNKNKVEPNDEKGNAAEKRTKSMGSDCEKRHSSISFGSTCDPEFETFCEPKEQHLEENKPVALPYRNITSRTPDHSKDLDDGHTVCFSQALVDYTKHSQMLQNSADDLEANSAFTPNMEALPTIVTFDVVDMHNEGEYDEQIHMELEEDISSPYQEFEESYLQKDAFAEFDYQMLDLYEQNLISNTWAIASLPRHLGLARVNQSMPNPLSLDRKSRSLDTESLDLNTPDTYSEAAMVSCPPAAKDSDRGSSPHYKNNARVPASDVKDCRSFMALSWQTRSEMALGLPLTDGEITEKAKSVSQAHVKHKIHPTPPSCDFPDGNLQRLCSNVSDGVSRGLMSQNVELYSRRCHLPLKSDSCLPRSTFVCPGMGEEVEDGIFCKAATSLQCGKSRPVANSEGMSHTGSVCKDE